MKATITEKLIRECYRAISAKIETRRVEGLSLIYGDSFSEPIGYDWEHRVWFLSVVSGGDKGKICSRVQLSFSGEKMDYPLLAERIEENFIVE